jgi:hypothetical protein
MSNNQADVTITFDAASGAIEVSENPVRFKDRRIQNRSTQGSTDGGIPAGIRWELKEKRPNHDFEAWLGDIVLCDRNDELRLTGSRNGIERRFSGPNSDYDDEDPGARPKRCEWSFIYPGTSGDAMGMYEYDIFVVYGPKKPSSDQIVDLTRVSLKQVLNVDPTLITPPGSG